MPVDDPAYPEAWKPMRVADGVGPPKSYGPAAISVQEKLFAQLDRYGFDVFMYVQTPGEGRRTPEVGDLEACEPFRPRGEGNRLECLVEKEEPWGGLASRDHSLWDQYYYPHDYGVNGFYQQHYGLYKSNEMRRIYEKRTGIKYDYVIRLRPDTVMLEPFPAIEDLKFKRDDGTHLVLYATLGMCCCGNEDWFGIGPAEVMDIYMNRFLYMPLRTYQGWHLGKRWTSEQFLEQFVKLYAGAEIYGEEQIKACLIKPKDRRGFGDTRKLLHHSVATGE